MKETLRPFARMIAAMVPVYNEQLQKVNPNEHVLKELKATIKWVVKHSGPLIPPKASEAALTLVRPHGINLFALKWGDQLTAEKLIAGRQIGNRTDALLFHEHKTPVEDSLMSILELGGDETAILEILAAQEIAWILRTENKRLRHRNRGDHNEAYKNAGIVLRPNPHGINWVNFTAFPR